MRIVHSWLNELAPVGDDIGTIAETMTDLGLAVEEIIHRRQLYRESWKFP